MGNVTLYFIKANILYFPKHVISGYLKKAAPIMCNFAALFGGRFIIVNKEKN